MTTAASKKCNDCGLVKPWPEFYKQANGRPRYLCIECTSKYNKGQRQKHIDKRREYDRERGTGWERSGRDHWNLAEPERHDKYLRRTYGISLDDYNAMLVAQNGLCAICQQTCNRFNSRRYCVDHDHHTGRVRGLLCFQCNVGLGKFRESAEVMQAAIQYLLHHVSEGALI